MISSPISGELARLRIASLHEAARHERLVRQAGHQHACQHHARTGGPA